MRVRVYVCRSEAGRGRGRGEGEGIGVVKKGGYEGMVGQGARGRGGGR